MGSVVISVDAELGWGFHDLDTPPSRRVEAARDGWNTLLDIFDRYDIPATWAVVGHLMLDTCDGSHEDLPAIEGWFARERNGWLDRPDLRFGKDLVEGILQSDTNHEIACHTFSHIIMDDPRLTREIVEADIQASIAAAQALGIEYSSFVFPRNAAGFREIIADYGFSCYRSGPEGPINRLRQSMKKIIQVANPSAIELVNPTIDEYGMVDLPASMYLFGFEGVPRTVVELFGTDPIVLQAKRGIDRASTEDGIFHMWLHPNNLQRNRDVERIHSIVRYLAEKRNEQSLTVRTMEQVAEGFLADGSALEHGRSIEVRDSPVYSEGRVQTEQGHRG